MAKDNREDLTKVVKVDGGIDGVDFFSCSERDVCCSGECEKQSQDTSGLTVTITADVDDAVSGLKRLQRELRKTTKKVRELGSAYKDVDLSEVPTKDLHEELREDD